MSTLLGRSEASDASSGRPKRSGDSDDSARSGASVGAAEAKEQCSHTDSKGDPDVTRAPLDAGRREELAARLLRLCVDASDLEQQAEVKRLIEAEGADPDGEAPHPYARQPGRPGEPAEPLRCTPFVEVCRRGNYELAVYFGGLATPEAGARVDLLRTDSGGRTGFWAVCNLGERELAWRLSIMPGMEPAFSKPDSHGVSPFMIACVQGHLETAQFVAKLPGVDVGAADEHGRTPFFAAVGAGKIAVAQWLATVDGARTGVGANDGATVLWKACREGRLELAKWLHESAGVDPEKANNRGETPLFAACVGEHLEVVRWLCSVGVDATRRSADGRHPFHVANRAILFDVCPKYFVTSRPEVRRGGANGRAIVSWSTPTVAEYEAPDAQTHLVGFRITARVIAIDVAANCGTPAKDEKNKDVVMDVPRGRSRSAEVFGLKDYRSYTFSVRCLFQVSEQRPVQLCAPSRASVPLLVPASPRPIPAGNITVEPGHGWVSVSVVVPETARNTADTITLAISAVIARTEHTNDARDRCGAVVAKEIVEVPGGNADESKMVACELVDLPTDEDVMALNISVVAQSHIPGCADSPPTLSPPFVASYLATHMKDPVLFPIETQVLGCRQVGRTGRDALKRVPAHAFIARLTAEPLRMPQPHAFGLFTEAVMEAP